MIDKQTNTRLKRFAQDARRYLIDQVNTKLSEVLAPDSDAATYEKTKPLYNGLLLEVKKVTGSESLPSEIDKLKPLAERVAYTWFNRLTALHYMDLKHFNPMGIVSPQAGDSLPQILSEAKMGIIDASLINPEDKQRVLGLLSGTLESTYHKGDAQSEAYRILLLGACNSIGKSLPFLFKPIKDWMELLLPDDLLGEHGILAMIREVMTEDACQDVEVIGWLYQYYISEKKDEVFANVKKGKKVQRHEIPAVTQLFTPHWIVKYMVQNSLGRLWLDSHPKSSLKAKMEYYVQADADPPIDNISSFQKGATASACTPEEIKFCDPCCGSGHILTYAFDLLYEIYSEEGYDPIDIPRLIISKNLHGIEIDERAAELAAFALSMKARDKDRQWFSRAIDPQICCLENISFGKDEIEPYLDRCGRDIFTLNFERMLSQFEHADTYGSLIVPHEQDIEGIRELLNAKDFSGDVFLAPTHNKVLKLIDQADYLSTKYQVVVTNPPYMGKGMSDQLSKYLNENYKDVKSDMFSAFIMRNLRLCLPGGQLGFMTPFVWMFISSYEKLRKYLIKNTCITSLVQLEYSGFDGATVPICTYTLANHTDPNYKGGYIKLSDFRGAENQAPRTLEAIANPDCGWFFHCKTSDFIKIPGAPIAYWVSDRTRNCFSHKQISDDYVIKNGLQTGNVNKYTRLWWEPHYSELFQVQLPIETKKGYKWMPCNNAGEFKKWICCCISIVNWENDGALIRADKSSRPQNVDYYFRSGVSWGMITSAASSFRYIPKGYIFDNSAPTAFGEDLEPLLCFLNSVVAMHFISLLNPTLNLTVSTVGSLPIMGKDYDVCYYYIDLLNITKDDWDSYETSWDFQQLPLLGVRCQGLGVRDCYAKLREQWFDNTLKMQELEEENNRIFIEAYGLQDELTPYVPLKEITLTCNPYYRYGVDMDASGEDGPYSKALIKPSSTLNQALTINAKLRLDEDLTEALKQERKVFPIRKDLEDRLLADTMKELISYAVGCMFGRYSLDKPGLILANQGDTLDDYVVKVLGVSRLGVRDEGLGISDSECGETALKPKTHKLTPSFMPDKDNVIPVLEGEWFVDDIVSRFAEFLKVAFGTEKYSENISFIEESLGKTIRAYFLKDFYSDHVKRYKKRPIYWLFSSPKGSFNALIYMHRYTPDTVSILLNGYLREYIHKVRAKVSQLEHQLNAGDQSERDKMLTRKEIDRLKEVVSELEFWDAKVLLPLAEKRIEIDLDDGVRVNYVKFSGAVRSIPGLAAKDE